MVSVICSVVYSSPKNSTFSLHTLFPWEEFSKEFQAPQFEKASLQTWRRCYLRPCPSPSAPGGLRRQSPLLYRGAGGGDWHPRLLRRLFKLYRKRRDEGNFSILMEFLHYYLFLKFYLFLNLNCLLYNN